MAAMGLLEESTACRWCRRPRRRATQVERVLADLLDAAADGGRDDR